MTRFNYLVVGGGMTADSATQGIRSLDGNGTIGMITGEPVPPYDRPPLSKGLWKGKPLRSIWRDTEARGVKVITHRLVVALDPERRQVTDNEGTIYRYESLLLATGGTPKRHPADDTLPIYYRTLDDYRTLRSLADQKQNFVVIGGGFIGSEIAAALTINGKSVTMAFRESGIGGLVLPPEVAGLLNRRFAEKGVRVFPRRGVTKIVPMGNGVEVYLEDGTQLAADAVVAGLGITPNTALATQAGLSVDNGIAVDECLRTSQANIYAAGDVASVPCPALNARVRFEHEDNANAMGKLAGRNMAGANEPYRHLPHFYSDLFDMSYEAIGETRPSHRTVTCWVKPEEKGAIFYLDRDHVRGVLFWNATGQLDAAGELIMSPQSYGDDDLAAWAGERLAGASHGAVMNPHINMGIPEKKGGSHGR